MSYIYRYLSSSLSQLYDFALCLQHCLAMPTPYPMHDDTHHWGLLEERDTSESTTIDYQAD